MSAPLKPLPAWADVALIPLVNVAAAFVISGFVVLAIGENPLEAVQSLVLGGTALKGSAALFYATSFNSLVAICFHAGLFRGTQGKPNLPSGATLVALFWFLQAMRGHLCIIGAAIFGAAFAAILSSNYRQPSSQRSCHSIASAIMGYVLVNVLRKPGK